MTEPHYIKLKPELELPDWMEDMLGVHEPEYKLKVWTVEVREREPVEVEG